MITEIQLIGIIIGLLFTHFVGDFIIQTDWQAKNKNTNIKALFSHVFTYTCFLFIGTVLINTSNFWINENFMINTSNLLAFTMVNGVLHFITDYVTSRINKKLWDKGNVHNFFVGVGADQFIHTTTLILTLYWFIK